MHPASLIFPAFIMMGGLWLLTFALVVGPAVWSRDPERRRDARSVLRIILEHLNRHTVVEEIRER
jgi:hypothetical protein